MEFVNFMVNFALPISFTVMLMAVFGYWCFCIGRGNAVDYIERRAQKEKDLNARK